jgi:hypothetical protein
MNLRPKAYQLFFSFYLMTTQLSGQSFQYDETASSQNEEDKKAGTESYNNNDTEAGKEDDKSNKKNDEPPKIGNFALPASQMPSGLFAFGGNIIDESEVQLYFFADYFRGKKRITCDLIPSVLFGVTKEFSILFDFPCTPVIKTGRQISSGFEDFNIQLEYAFYTKTTLDYADQATIVGNVTAPTGSAKKNPPTGYGSPSFFLGGTYYHMKVDWFVFTSQGAILTTSNHGTKIGDQFLYQFGLGRNIASPEGWIYAWMVEVDGQYQKKNRIKGKIDNNSGGNALYATPSIWISSRKMLFQLGVSIPLNQNLFGHQYKFDYAINLNFAWSFY